MEDNRIFEKEPQWEQDSELRRIRKTIRRRNRKNICISVLLAAVLLLPLIWELDGIWWSVVAAEFAALLLTIFCFIK